MEYITLAHGAGGKVSHDLMTELILPAFDNEILHELHDGAKLKVAGSIAFTTDSYVVSPRFFPGGNIGKLAICGTVNDLAMTGAKPKFLSAAVIIEEGFPLAELKKIVATMGEMAKEAGVMIVTGDTKVVERGKCDGIFINTAGIGEILPGVNIAPKNVRPGMKIIVSGTIGDHGATILAERHGLEVPESLMSDCAPLSEMVEKMLAVAPDIAMLRDATRGGVATVLNEIAESSESGIIIEEEKLPINEPVQGVADILGFDVLNLANEGKLIAVVPAEKAESIVAAMHETKYGKNAQIIGETINESKGMVGLKTAIGSIRIVDMPMGSLVPRIC